jgi:hypothetical protein
MTHMYPCVIPSACADPGAVIGRPRSGLPVFVLS